jgi:hypothetical protein
MKYFPGRSTQWTCVIASTLIGLVVVAACSRRFDQITLAGVQRWLLMSVVVMAATALVAAPCISFLVSGWRQRLDEFKNLIRKEAVDCYLKQFWQCRLDPTPNATEQQKESLFVEIYNEHNGRWAFVAPIILLLGVTFVSAMLVVQTGIDACWGHACVGSRPPGGRFAPLGDITLPSGSAAAMGGAYLFVAWDLIRRARCRTLNVSDVAWYVLRLILAIPIGLAFAAVVKPDVTALVTFGLGAFPLDAILKQLRRLTNKSIGGGEEAQDNDQLVQLDGVTMAIATQLAAEGIDSIDELVGCDPVLLSVRSGVPFASVLRFASQAVVRIHFGPQASKLVPIALGNAYLISQFVLRLDNELPGSQQRLADALSQLRTDANAAVPSAQTVEAGFRAVAAHGYTKFLASIS